MTQTSKERVIAEPFMPSAAAIMRLLPDEELYAAFKKAYSAGYAAALERAAQAVKQAHVNHGDHSASYFASSVDAENLAATIRALKEAE